MMDWRLISLCNEFYKFVSKVLINRLKGLLHKCISVEQYTFVPERSILDNVMFAFEVILYLNKHKGKKGEIALKVNMSKTCDRVDWNYVLLVLKKIGFHDIWVGWMKMCIECKCYSIIVNEKPVGPIVPGRGLRQGDPLSSYLFILCVVGLTSLILQKPGDCSVSAFGGLLQ